MQYAVSKNYNRITRTILASSCPIDLAGIFWGGTTLGVSSLIALTSFAFTKTTFFRLSTKKFRNYLVRSTTWLTQHCTEHTEQHHHHHTTNNRHNNTRIGTESQYTWNERLLCDSLTFVLTFRVRVECRRIGRESDGCQQHWTGSGLLVWATITLCETNLSAIFRRLIVFNKTSL